MSTKTKVLTVVFGAVLFSAMASYAADTDQAAGQTGNTLDAMQSQMRQMHMHGADGTCNKSGNHQGTHHQHNADGTCPMTADGTCNKHGKHGGHGGHHFNYSDAQSVLDQKLQIKNDPNLKIGTIKHVIIGTIVDGDGNVVETYTFDHATGDWTVE